MSTAASDPKSPQARCIHCILEAWAERTPEAIAIAAPGRAPLTYHRLLTQVKSVTKALNSAGIGRNDRVIVALPDGPEMAVAFLSVAAGATCAPLNPAYRARELVSYFARLDARALIVPSDSDSTAKTVARSLGIPVLELSPLAEAEAGLFALGGVGNSRAARSGFAEPGDVALVLQTSGTTSRPKIVPLTQSNLCASADNIRAALDLNQSDRCLNVMPLFHIHGLIGAVLSSLAAGGSVVCTPGFYAPQFFEWLDEFRPTWYTAAPTIHQGVLTRARTQREAVERSSLRFIRSCSAPLPPRLASELEETFAAPVIDSYGMTEACHQIASSPLGRRKSGSVGVAAGTEVAIVDEAGNRLPSGADGEIAIRGANVMQGYEGAPEINRQAFTNGWLRTGDVGHLDNDGYLYITGRLKEIINRAGEKISSAEVEEALLAHPDVKQAVVFAAPHIQLGEEVAAAVALRDGAQVSAGELRRFVAERVADFKVPSRIVFVSAIPTGPTGKVERLRLAETLGLLPEPIDERAAYVAPRTPLENQLASFWSEVLGVPRVGIHDNFFALGGDSILAAQLLSRIRANLRAELSFVSFFDAPTIAAIAGLLEAAGRHAPALESIHRSDGRETPPLSYSQERMWFFNQFEPRSPVYNRPILYRVTGRPNASVIERSVTEIVKRHENFRTTFSSRSGRPCQVISPSPAAEFQSIDLTKLPKSERAAEAERLAAAECKKPFDLERGPLLRVTLIALNETEHLLLMVTHHIVFDGWSEAIFVRELTVLYDTFQRGLPSPLPPLPIQYVDYALWQRRQMQGRFFDEHLSYWKRQLSGVPVFELPTDRPRPAMQTFRGAKKSVVFPKTLSGDLKTFSRREGATLFMTLLAAFQTLLHRYTGQDDIVLGSPIAGRLRPEIEGLIGVFINTLAFRGDLSGDPSFTELIARLRNPALEAYEHQDLPFERLIKELRPERDPSRAPLFQVMFVFENTPRAALELPGLKASPFEVDCGTAKLDLTLSMEEAAGSLKAIIEYNTDLFEHDTVARMLGHFETLLRDIVTHPERRLSELSILTETERHRQLVEWNDTKRDYPQDRCIHELFEEQVEKTPDATAVVFEDERLTYRELNLRANRLAHYLRKRGVGPEVLAGVCVERSLEMIVGLLAILKAGGAYVPLDPDYPTERLAFMLKDAKLHTVLTRQKLLGRLGLQGTPAVCLDIDGDAIAREPEENLFRVAAPGSLVYVIYTSGSTGWPKGVQVTHGALVNYICVLGDAFGLGPGDRVLQFSSIGFDSSAEEIFHCLARGATLVLRTDAMLSSARAFLEKCREWGVTMLPLPTSYWHEIAAALSAGDAVLPEQVRWVHVGGERILPERVTGWRKSVSEGVRLLNSYGPTETTVVATMCDIGKTDPATSSREVPIGRPISNVQTYILDKYQNPVPIGIPGELHIGGAGLARGYLNSPELTAEKFIPNPFSDEPGARLYKSGDLARYLPDGNIEFLGRIDDQVKIRGFRVEPGEVEAVLGQHPSVRDAVVLAWEQSPGDNRLVAYMVAAKTEAFPMSDLREFLRQKLPDYMIPSSFVFLQALPLTPNGKLDRRALPAPDRTRPELGNPFEAPQSSIEETLANIWSQVLGLERVGVHDNFFDLGGHSLLATQVISRAWEVYRIEISLRNFFETPTIAGLADLIQRAKQSGAENPMSQISRVSRQSSRTKSPL